MKIHFDTQWVKTSNTMFGIIKLYFSIIMFGIIKLYFRALTKYTKRQVKYLSHIQKVK